jgi:glycosyltransferase involved in cell wall biosynthesis
VWAVLRLARLMRRGRFDVVHTHLYRAGIYGRLAARLAGVPRVVATEHSLLDDQLEGRPAGRGVRALYLAAERLGHLTIAVSSAVRTNLLGWGIPLARLRRVPNGLDLPALAFDAEDRAAVRKALDVPDSAQVIGAVGRLHPGKRFDSLIGALAPELGPGRRLLIVGDGSERARLLATAQRLGVAAWVHLVGEQPVAPHLSAMDVLVSPSRYETFGLVVLEGLANGLPVVYRRCPALEELDVPVAEAVRLGDGRDDSVRTAVESLLSRPAGERTCPPALGGLDVRVVAGAIDDLYDALPARGSGNTAGSAGGDVGTGPGDARRR